MTERERLIEELSKRGLRLGAIKTLNTAESIIVFRASMADFIINDRKRICEPLVRWNEDDKRGNFGNDYNNHLEGARRANRETLKLAGQQKG